jgi:hypothetical protein
VGESLEPTTRVFSDFFVVSKGDSEGVNADTGASLL